MVSTAIILAGGLGTRLKSVNPVLPKPLAPINGRPFLEYLFDYWIAQGISKFILSIGYQSQSIIDHFAQNYRGASIEYSVENSPLGTGGGLLLSAKSLTETFLVLNGDTFFEVDLKDLFSFHVNKKSEWTISLFRTDNFQRYMPMEISMDGLILKVKEINKQASYLSNGGVYLMNPSVLKNLDKYVDKKFSLESDLLPESFSSGASLYGLECVGGFIDIGIPEDYYRAQKILSRH
jgi:D-glycero-alpha-D-manno-heptose 1-phosphate guanylyltransferase|tara:strand:+ start:9467 stop:10171 length:705 start_codon:yes stop_codon:yes gene_type:complete